MIKRDERWQGGKRGRTFRRTDEVMKHNGRTDEVMKHEGGAQDKSGPTGGRADGRSKMMGVYLQLDWTSCDEPRKINLPANQKGYDTFETTVGKLSARKFRSALSIFVKSIFDLLFFETSENRVPTKIDKADLDSPRRIV